MDSQYNQTAIPVIQIDPSIEDGKVVIGKLLGYTDISGDQLHPSLDPNLLAWVETQNRRGVISMHAGHSSKVWGNFVLTNDGEEDLALLKMTHHIVHAVVAVSEYIAGGFGDSPLFLVLDKERRIVGYQTLFGFKASFMEYTHKIFLVPPEDLVRSLGQIVAMGIEGSLSRSKALTFRALNRARKDAEF